MATAHPARHDPRLETYRRKREFRKTPEPVGRLVAGDRKIFVVHKHGARRLHYDLRLELNGVLLSWAVPKGPSMDPSVKRLAVHVEDHPLEYADFEGTIPKGEYGAGAVIVWDRGLWKPGSDPVQGYKKGHLKFSLHGQKLKGGWDLVRTSGMGEEGEKNWLLIKRRDKESDGSNLLEEEPESVKSGSTLEELASGKKPKKSKRRQYDPVPDASGLPGATASKRPRLLRPQLAAPTTRVPRSGDWLYEVKFDGYRILAFIGKRGCRLISRSGKDWSARFKRLCASFRNKGWSDAVVDGEIVYVRPDGTSDFQALQNSFRSKDDAESLAFFAFDLPYFDGFDLTETPLIDRKAFLQKILAAGEAAPGVHFSEHVRGMGDEFLRFACQSRLEGIICKKADAPYRQERSTDWLKLKCLNRQEFVVGGFTPPGGSRHGLGALLLGFHDDAGNLRYCGRVGTGFDRDSLSDLVRRLGRRVRKDPPFVNPPAELLRQANWTDPRLVVEVEFKEWTREGLLRQPSYVAIRDDKKPREIRKEAPAKADPNGAGDALRASDGRRGMKGNKDIFAGVRITHPDRVVYQEQGITKRELAEYYERISGWILPHVAKRPLAVFRCPKGQRGDCFFQKNVTETLPEEINSVKVKEKGETRDYIMIDGVKGLITLVQFGTLELHPWGSTSEMLESPDRMIFDLDPAEGKPWKEIVQAAFMLRSFLEDIGIRSFARTTGGKGLHVVIPLVRRAGWDEIRALAAAMADRIAGRHPDRYVRTMTRSARKGKIFIDHFRNRRGATAIASYSTRARAGAPVAAPVSWEELADGIDPAAFTIRTVPDRLERLKEDPWKGFFEVRQSFGAEAKRTLLSRAA